MKKLTILVVLLMSWATAIHAKTIDIKEAVAKGLIHIKASGEGGHTGRCLKLSLHNPGKKKLEIAIPAGLIFRSEQDSEQDLMVIEDKSIVVEGNHRRVTKLYAACIEAPKGSPNEGSGFEMNELATGNLLQVANYLSQEALYKSEAAQYAVWAVSNDKRVEYIDNRPLAIYVADMLNLPHPEYVVLHRTVSSPGAPAYRESPVVVKGQWKYKVEKAQVMTFGLYTKEGELKQAFFTDVKQKEGLHKFRFTCKVMNMPQGEYAIRMMHGDDMIAEKDIVF